MQWVDYIIQAMEELGGYASYTDLYRKIQEIRPEPFTEHWEASVRQIVESNSSDSHNFRGRNVFYSVNGIGSGIWGLHGYASETPKPDDIEETSSEAPAKRIEQKTYRILRDTEISQSVKKIHSDHCQICGYAIRLPDGKHYSEAHHIKPLGKPHNGPDLPSNILCLCPNHHAELDYGVIAIDVNKLTLNEKHTIAPKFVDYHNNFIFNPKPKI
jgi:hypothetical protein